MKKILLTLLSTILLLSGCSTTKLEPYDFTSIQLGFDTVISFRAYCESEAEFEQYKQVLSDAYLEYDQIFSKYNDFKGNIKDLNDHAGTEVEVHPEIIKLLKEAQKYQELSNNQFDVTMGALLSIWHHYREQAENEISYQIPTDNELASVKDQHGWEHIEINEDKNTVKIKSKDISLDLGGIAKGYATQRVAEKLAELGLKHGFINAGGNVVVIGAKPDNSPIRVGLQIPDKTNLQTNSLMSISIEERMAFVTSGNYQRYYEVDGKTYHHIIDPDTSMPAAFFDSVTIITPDSTMADALSTAFFNMSLEEGHQLLQQLKNDGIEIDVIWVSKEPFTQYDDFISTTSNGYHITYSDTLSNRIVK